MNNEEFNLLVENELDWLRYYAWSKTREKLNLESNIYEDLVSIGYTKRVISLDSRCARGILSSDNPITKDTKLEEMYFVGSPRKHSENRYTPLEVYLILYPEKKEEVIINLKSNIAR